LNPNIDIKGKQITVIGAGRSGLAVSGLLSRYGAKVLLSEKNTLDSNSPNLQTLQDLGVEIESGGHSDKIFEADLWVDSPGLPVDHPMIQKAKEKSIPVYGELEAASWFCKSPMIAITGSNGKSTTTALTGEIFKQAGLSTLIAGNIGTPFSQEVEKSKSDGIAVVEVSNFQLETIESFHPKISMFLNLTPDHLDRHGSMEAYGKLKARIFENQTPEDWIIYNREDAAVTKLLQTANCKKAAFGLSPHDETGGYLDGDTLVLNIQGKREDLLPVSEMLLKGRHNAANALASAIAARMMDVPLQDIRTALKTFAGLAHRLEFIRERNGVTWYNDSKATNINSVRFALTSFPKSIIWIAGGRDKDSDFTFLADSVKQSVKAAILIGEAADKIQKAFEGMCPIQNADTLSDTIQKADALAQPGDVVLLSPGCASFDMFRDFEDRGDQFKSLVMELA